MANERLRTKLELKKFVATNIKRKGITDDMLSILIDVLWRDRYTLRTSGFFEPGGTDAIINFDVPTRTFSIEPFDPQVADFIPRFGFFSWTNSAIYHRVFKKEEIEIPDEEGLFAIYYGLNSETRLQQLYFIKNPIDTEIENLYTNKVIVSFIYLDATNHEVLHFGDDRHGSEWNPQIHRYLHDAFHARRKSGITLTGMVINGDGSDDAHAKFSVTSGVMLHDDFELDIPAAGGNNAVPVLFRNVTVPRFSERAGYGIINNASRVSYNPDGEQFVQANDYWHVLYHIFATNEIGIENRKVISVCGVAQYEFLADAYAGFDADFDAVTAYMPQQGRLHIGTIVVQTSDAYTNTMHARIVGVIGGDVHPPVTIEEKSKKFLEINNKQELSFTPYLEGINNNIIYDEGWEWAVNRADWPINSVDLYDTDNPFTGEHSLRCASAGAGYRLIFITEDSLTPKKLKVADYYDLSFEMWLQAQILPDTYSFSVYFMLDDTIISDVLPVVLDYDLYDGSQPYTVQAWQHVELLIADLNFSNAEFNKMVFVTNHNGVLADYLGFYLDWVKLKKTEGMPVPAVDGITPHIGANGNWYFEDTDTGVKAAGTDGDDGNGIVSVTLTNTVGLVKTYTVTFTDATTFDFDVTDGQDATADTGIKVAIDFVDATNLEFIYNCPVTLKFTSQESEGADATISPALDTNMAQYGKVTVTAPAVGLIVLNGITL